MVLTYGRECDRIKDDNREVALNGGGCCSRNIYRQLFLGDTCWAARVNSKHSPV